MVGGKQVYIINTRLYDDKIVDALKLQTGETGGTDAIDL